MAAALGGTSIASALTSTVPPPLTGTPVEPGESRASKMALPVPGVPTVVRSLMRNRSRMTVVAGRSALLAHAPSAD